MNAAVTQPKVSLVKSTWMSVTLLMSCECFDRFNASSRACESVEKVTDNFCPIVIGVEFCHFLIASELCAQYFSTSKDFDFTVQLLTAVFAVCESRSDN